MRKQEAGPDKFRLGPSPWRRTTHDASRQIEHRKQSKIATIEDRNNGLPAKSRRPVRHTRRS
jgi:hypothetical protein